MGDGDPTALLQEVFRVAVLDGVLAGGAAPAQDEDGSGGTGGQPGVVVRPHPGGIDDAVGEAVEVDDHLGGVGVARGPAAGGIVAGGTTAGTVGLTRLRLPFILVASPLVPTLLLIASRQEGRGLVGAEEREVQRARHRTVERRHVQPAGVEPVVGGGQEVEVFARLVPHRRDGVGHPVGELVRLSGFRIVDEDRAQLVVQAAGVGEPAGVRRPDGVHRALRMREAVGVDVLHLARLQVEHQHLVVGVGEGQPGTVGRPLGPKVEGWLVDLDPPPVRPILLGDHQPVLIAVVVEPGDARPVRRPHRVPVGHSGGAGQVAPRTLLGGHAEEFAAPLEDRALAGGGEAGVAQLPGRNRLPSRTRPVHVAGHVDRQLAGGTGGRIELVQVTGLLVDDHPVARAEGLHVEVGVVRELALGTGAGVEGPHVAGPVALGHEVDDAVHPHRVHLALALPGGRGALPGVSGDDADRLRLAAPVVPPLGVPVADLLVGDVGAVGGHAAQVGLGQREGSRQPARRWHRVELPETGGRCFASRLEEDVAVGCPALRDIGGWVPGEALGLAAGGRHEVDVGVAVVLTGKGDPAPVGAEGGVGLRALGAGQADRVAAVPRDLPEVVGVREDDVRGAHVGLTQEARALGLGGGGGEEGGGEGDGQGGEGGWEGGARHRLGLRAGGRAWSMKSESWQLGARSQVGGPSTRTVTDQDD